MFFSDLNCFIVSSVIHENDDETIRKGPRPWVPICLEGRSNIVALLLREV